MSGWELVLGGRYFFNLTSKCVDNEKVNVEITATGIGLSVGVEFSGVSSSVTLNVPWNHTAPDTFNSGAGGFSMLGAGFSIPPTPQQQLGQQLAGCSVPNWHHNFSQIIGRMI